MLLSLLCKEEEEQQLPGCHDLHACLDMELFETRQGTTYVHHIMANIVYSV